MSTADTVLAAALVANPHRRRLRYVLKRELLWDPCLDIVGQRLPNVFVGREAEARGPQLERLRRLAGELGPDEGVLIYPEGARFAPRKLGSALERLEREGPPELLTIAKGYRSVLPPRLAGSLALLEATRGHDVLFLEHSGFEGAHLRRLRARRAGRCDAARSPAENREQRGAHRERRSLAVRAVARDRRLGQRAVFPVTSRYGVTQGGPSAHHTLPFIRIIDERVP